VPTGHTLTSGVLGSRRLGRVGRCRIPIPDQHSLVGLFLSVERYDPMLYNNYTNCDKEQNHMIEVIIHD